MPVSKAAQLEEIVRCGKDPVYFTNKYLKISHAERGLIPFKTYPFQDECMRDFAKHRFNIVLKSRQLGLSTITAAFALWRAMFYREKNVLVIATKMAVATNFVRKVKTMLEGLPKWLVVPDIVSETKTSIEFSNGSIVKSVPTSEDAGRSEALSLLIIDEAAFIRNFDELWKGLYPTLSTGGSAIVLSTPNGVGNQYHRLWVDAEEEKSAFHPIKLMWDVHPERDQNWFDNESKNMTRKQIAQELLCDFASSGDTFLGAEDLEKVRMGCRQPLETWGPDKGVWVWKYPVTDHKYVLSADVARGDSNDYSTVQVFDINDSEQVCEFRGKVPPDQFGILINEIGLRYNKALVCPENNTYGFATITKLRDMGYPNLHINDKRYLYAVEIPIGKYGFNTNGSSRGPTLTKFEEYIRLGNVRIYSSRLVDELKTFVWLGDSPKAQKGFHDDLVLAAAIGCSLFDPSNKGSSNSDAYKAMLNGFSVNKTTTLPQPIFTGNVNPMKPVNYDTRFFESGDSPIPPELMWMYR
jgi:hypothetical protein